MAEPVHVDQFTRRSDDDALTGSLVQIREGEHAGQTGAWVKVERHGKDGYPERVIVRLTDTAYKGGVPDSMGLVSEPYENLRTVRQDLVL